MSENHENAQMTTLDYARAIVDIISDVKGEDVVLLDLRDITVITDFFIICTGNSDRQLKAVVERISEVMKQKHGLSGARIEGNPEGGWVLLDYGDIVVHVFIEDQRDYYDLEGLWSKGKVLLRVK